MTDFNTDLTKALLEQRDLNDFFREQLEFAMNQLLQAELSSVLGYEPYERSEGLNARNGGYSRSFDTRYGKLNLTIPRDRLGLFHQHLLPDYQRRSDHLEETVIQLYSRGITTREIADLIEKMYGSYYSPATISNLTEIVDEQVKAFQKRQISTQYAFVYLDATYLPLRRDSVSKEPIHIALGITHTGKKEILAYKIAPTESLEIYQELLDQLKSQGACDVLMFLTDGFSGLSNLIKRNFPKAKHQECLVHLARNIFQSVRVKHRTAIMEDFKKIRIAEEVKDAKQAIQALLDKWGKLYPKLEKLMDKPDLLTFFDFPKAIRSSIYSTNLLESYNKELKRQAKKHIQFPNEAALERFLVTQFMNYNGRFEERTHKGFAQISDTLESMFH
jgi:putative transposase